MKTKTDWQEIKASIKRLRAKGIKIKNTNYDLHLIINKNQIDFLFEYPSETILFLRGFEMCLKAVKI